MLRIAGLVFLAGLFTAGCASEVVRYPASLASEPSTGLPPRIELVREISVRLSSGYERILPVGSVWEARGTVPQGIVYKRLNGVFTVEGAHIHEAFLVVASDRLVGFYLPVEKAFSPIEPVVLSAK